MNPLQSAKQELEASIRYCENAMSSAKQVIESMAVQQQQTGREAALERDVTRLAEEVAFYTQKYDEAKTNMALMTDELEKLRSEKSASSGQCGCQGYRDKEEEIATLKDQLEELSKAYKDSTNEEVTMKKAWREQRELVALRDDQIAMLERRLAKYTGEKVYPFKEGDLYYVLNQLDGTWTESVWDDESERLHDSTDFPDHPHKVYFTVDQKNVLDKFNPES